MVGFAALVVAQGGEVRVGDGDGEAGVRLLEVGGESELDVVECSVSVDEVEL